MLSSTILSVQDQLPEPGDFNSKAHIPQLTAEVLFAKQTACMGVVSNGIKAAVVTRREKALQEDLGKTFLQVLLKLVECCP